MILILTIKIFISIIITNIFRYILHFRYLWILILFSVRIGFSTSSSDIAIRNSNSGSIQLFTPCPIGFTLIFELVSGRFFGSDILSSPITWLVQSVATLSPWLATPTTFITMHRCRSVLYYLFIWMHLFSIYHHILISLVRWFLHHRCYYWGCKSPCPATVWKH